jgi:hypothetical protein
MNWKDLTNKQKMIGIVIVIAVAVLISIVWYSGGFTSTVDESTAGKAMKAQALSSSSNVLIPKFLSSDDNGNLSLFDLDKHTTENDFSAKSLSSLKGDIKVAAGAQLCIGSTCISEADLKQIGYDGASHESVITYKPSEIFNKLAMKTAGRKYTRYFYKFSLPASEQAGVPFDEGNIVTEIPAGQDGFIKQTIYDTTNTVPNVACRYSKTSLKNIANDDNWGPFSVVGTPFYQGSNGLLMQNWKLVDSGGLRFHYDANQSIVAQKTGFDAVTQKFLMATDGKAWDSSTNDYYSNTFIKKSNLKITSGNGSGNGYVISREDCPDNNGNGICDSGTWNDYKVINFR